MIFDEKSLEERKYTAVRKKSAIIATSRPYTIAMIILTIAYTLEVFIYLAIEEIIEGASDAGEEITVEEAKAIRKIMLKVDGEEVEEELRDDHAEHRVSEEFHALVARLLDGLDR